MLDFSLNRRIAISRGFGLVLNKDGSQTFVGHCSDMPQLHSNERIIKVVAAFEGYMGLTEDGHIVTCGPAREFERCHQIESLSNIKDIAASEGHTVAITQRGDVLSIDEPGGWEGVPNHSQIVQNWHLIKQVAVGYANIMGLTIDGRVLYHSEDQSTDCHFYEKYKNVVQVDCYSHYYGTDSSAILLADGTVVSDTFKGVKKWRNIVCISVGADVIVGLKRDGTIEMIDNRNKRYQAKEWSNLEAVCCKFFGVIGITRDGEILSIFNQ